VNVSEWVHFEEEIGGCEDRGGLAGRFVRLPEGGVRSVLRAAPVGKGVSAMARAQGHHQHEALKHRHKHFHVTHYLHRGENWGHLLSTHAHEHNHPAVDHVHIPHEDAEKEHRREAHVHDHARPAESPA